MICGKTASVLNNVIYSFFNITIASTPWLYPIIYIRFCYGVKRALRHIHRSSYNSHTNPLFSDSKILRLGDLYELEVGKLMYDAIRNTLPTPLSFLYIPNSTVHSHNTRQRHESHVQVRRSMVATHSLTHKAHGIWSATPQQTKELNTRSKFKRSLKRQMLSKYKLHMWRWVVSGEGW